MNTKAGVHGCADDAAGGDRSEGRGWVRRIVAGERGVGQGGTLAERVVDRAHVAGAALVGRGGVAIAAATAGAVLGPNRRSGLTLPSVVPRRVEHFYLGEVGGTIVTAQQRGRVHGRHSLCRSPGGVQVRHLLRE